MGTEKDPSKIFHDRVKNLLWSAGFDVIKSDYYSVGADIIVTSENKKILVQCKCSQSNDKTFPSIERLIDEYSRKAQKENAERAILAISGYTIPAKYKDQEFKEKTALFDKVVIWDDDIIEYYEEVIKALNQWAKYTILGDLEIKSKFGGPIKTHYLKIHQGDFDFFVFKINPEELLKIAYIFRRDYSPKAYQRTLKLNRLKKEISVFLDGPEGFLPSNIIGVFNGEIRIEDKFLFIPRQYKSFWIIDGQHRLYSFCYTKDDLKRSNFELFCVGLLGKNWSPSEQAKIFVDLNSKSKKVDRLLLLDLYELIGLPDMRVELVKKMAKESDVFKNKIKISRKDKGPISLVTFATTTPMNRLVSGRSEELGFFFKERYGLFPDHNKPNLRERCKDFYFKILNDYFKKIKEAFPEEWENHNKYILSTDRGIRVLLRLFRKIEDYNLNHEKKFDDSEITQKIIESLKGFDFSLETLKNRYLGEGGSEEFLESLKKQIQKTIPDFFPKQTISRIIKETIESSDQERANILIGRWLPKIGKSVAGELSYIDPSTFDYLTFIEPGSEIKLLCSVIKDEPFVLEKCKELKEKGYNIQIKKITKGEQKTAYLHERWLGGEHHEINFGQDLKKSSIGNKKHTIEIFVGITNSEKMDEFNSRWKEISKFKDKEIQIENIFS